MKTLARGWAVVVGIKGRDYLFWQTVRRTRSQAIDAYVGGWMINKWGLCTSCTAYDSLERGRLL